MLFIEDLKLGCTFGMLQCAAAHRDVSRLKCSAESLKRASSISSEKSVIHFHTLRFAFVQRGEHKVGLIMRRLIAWAVRPDAPDSRCGVPDELHRRDRGFHGDAVEGTRATR